MNVESVGQTGAEIRGEQIPPHQKSDRLKKVSLIALGVLSLGALAVVAGQFLPPGSSGPAAVGSASFLAMNTSRGSMSAGLAKIGSAALAILGTSGRYLFYAVAVPAYGMGYAAPRWIGNKALPMIAAKVAKFTPQIQTAAQWMGSHVGKPLAMGINRAAGAVFHHVAVPAFQAIHRLGVALGPKIEGVIRSVTPVVQRAVAPVFSALEKAALFAGPKIGRGIEWSFVHILIPGAEGLGKLTMEAVAIANRIGHRLSKVALAVHQYVLSPIITQVITPAGRIAAHGFQVAAIKAGQLWQETAVIFSRLTGAAKAAFA